jgi:hypothetical protein
VRIGAREEQCADACVGTRRRGPQDGGGDLWHGPIDFAGLAAPLQRQGLAGLRNLIKSSGPGSKLTTRQQAELNWPSLSRPVPIRRATGWWVGGESICATKLERRFGVVLTNVQGAPMATARRAPYAIPSTYLISSSQSGVRCFDAAGRDGKIKRLKEATEFLRD